MGRFLEVEPYIRADQNLTYVWEALKLPAIYNDVRTAMLQSCAVLNKEYPLDLPVSDLIEHTDDLLDRFQNKALGDTIFRVGKDPQRKLGHEDRLIGAMLLAKKHQLPCEVIAKAAVVDLEFYSIDANGKTFSPDLTCHNTILFGGSAFALKNVCNLSHSNPIEQAVVIEIEKAISARQKQLGIIS